MLFNFMVHCSKRETDMKYRDKLDIISLILEAANGSYATKTKIMYKAFLSYAQLKEYLTILTANNLLRHDFLSQKFKTTEKGDRFCVTYREIDEMIKVPPQQQYLVRKTTSVMKKNRWS